MCLNRMQMVELFEYAKQQKLVLFEGIKTAYCPGFAKLLGIACSDAIGSIKGVDACFTKLESGDKRELTDKVYGGSFTELGSYCLLPIIKLFGQKYEEIRFESIKATNGVDFYAKAHVQYANGLTTATCGLGVKSEDKILIAGTAGYIAVEAPWWKTSYFEVHKEKKFIHEDLGAQGLQSEVF